MIFRALMLSIVATSVIAVSAAFACSCVRFASAETQLRNAEVMFVGRAIETTTREDNGMTVGVTRFVVERTLKGDARNVQTVEHLTTMGGMCGVVFARGQAYTILASAHRGRLATGSCSRPQFPIAEFEKALGLRP
jgi:hypothetical protein